MNRFSQDSLFDRLASTDSLGLELMPRAGRAQSLKRRVMRRIVAKAGGDTDTSRDYEYTDWEVLRVFCEKFATRLSLAERPVAASA